MITTDRIYYQANFKNSYKNEFIFYKNINIIYREIQYFLCSCVSNHV